MLHRWLGVAQSLNFPVTTSEADLVRNVLKRKIKGITPDKASGNELDGNKKTTFKSGFTFMY